MRCWPSDSLRARPAWTDFTVPGSKPSRSLWASAQACSAVSRVMTCSRIPKRTVRPSFAASPRTQAIFSATWAGGSPQVR